MLVGISAAKGSIRNSSLAINLGRQSSCQTTGLHPTPFTGQKSERQQEDCKQVVCVNGKATPNPELAEKHIFLWEISTALLPYLSLIKL